MNNDKAKRLLKKVQALFDNLSDQGNISALERDLLLSYLRELYEEINSTSATGNSAGNVVSDHVHEPIRKKPFDEPAVTKSTVLPIQDWREPPKPVLPEVVHTRVEQIVTPFMHEPVAFVAPVDKPDQTDYTPSPSPAKPIQGTHDKAEAALAGLFEFKEVGDLSEKLKMQPIERIEHGLGINERILSINELFNGDSDLFRQTLDYLNSLKSFQDARAYLTEGVATQFNWADESRKSKATYFIELVRRKYVVN